MLELSTLERSRRLMILSDDAAVIKSEFHFVAFQSQFLTCLAILQKKDKICESEELDWEFCCIIMHKDARS